VPLCPTYNTTTCTCAQKSLFQEKGEKIEKQNKRFVNSGWKSKVFMLKSELQGVQKYMVCEGPTALSCDICVLARNWSNYWTRFLARLHFGDLTDLAPPLCTPSWTLISSICFETILFCMIEGSRLGNILKSLETEEEVGIREQACLNYCYGKAQNCFSGCSSGRLVISMEELENYMPNGRSNSFAG